MDRMKGGNFFPFMQTITIERVETKETTIQVDATTPEEAFDRARAGEGQEVGTVKKSELVIRDYPKDSVAQE